MFKIHDDKVYFVAETPNINKVIEMTAYRKICFALIRSSGCRVNRTADTPRTKL